MAEYQISPALSGERFNVHYRLSGIQDEAAEKAGEICLEQPAEFPGVLLPAGDIAEAIVGKIEALEPGDANHWEAVISFAVETAGAELTQLMNVIFGNISIKPGIRVERLELPPGLLRHFKGPRFGREKLRTL